MGFDKCIMPCDRHCGITWNSFTVLKRLVCVTRPTTETIILSISLVQCRGIGCRLSTRPSVPTDRMRSKNQDIFLVSWQRARHKLSADWEYTHSCIASKSMYTQFLSTCAIYLPNATGWHFGPCGLCSLQDLVLKHVVPQQPWEFWGCVFLVLLLLSLAWWTLHINMLWTWPFQAIPGSPREQKVVAESIRAFWLRLCENLGQMARP